MAFFIFDFDGTLADVAHRRHLLERNDWDGFFDACDQDPPIEAVLTVFQALATQTVTPKRGAPTKEKAHRVEIWSGRSMRVQDKSRTWLAHKGVDPAHLTRMRPVGDYMPDEKLKQRWLEEELAAGNRPDVIFDDRQKVVDMWRGNGMACFQVNEGDFDSPLTVQANPIYKGTGLPILTLLIGTSGAGKSTIARRYFDQQAVISADTVRKFLTGSPHDQSRNTDVWHAIKALIKTRLSVGLPTILDATNLKRKSRRDLAMLTPLGFTCAYVLVQERSLEELEATAGARNDVVVGKKGFERSLLRAHADKLKSNMPFIMAGDDLPFVRVYPDVAAYARECQQIAVRPAVAQAQTQPEAVAAGS